MYQRPKLEPRYKSKMDLLVYRLTYEWFLKFKFTRWIYTYWMTSSTFIQCILMNYNMWNWNWIYSIEYIHHIPQYWCTYQIFHRIKFIFEYSIYENKINKFEIILYLIILIKLWIVGNILIKILYGFDGRFDPRFSY